jgi:hypothetical protein
MNVRELMRILIDADPEAEVMTCTDLSLSKGQSLIGILDLPTRDAEIGSFPHLQINGDLAGKNFVMIISTDAWGISPRVRSKVERYELIRRQACIVCTNVHLPGTKCPSGDGGSFSPAALKAVERSRTETCSCIMPEGEAGNRCTYCGYVVR